jgi:hypothetical protein
LKKKISKKKEIKMKKGKSKKKSRDCIKYISNYRHVL